MEGTAPGPCRKEDAHEWQRRGCKEAGAAQEGGFSCSVTWGRLHVVWLGHGNVVAERPESVCRLEAQLSILGRGWWRKEVKASSTNMQLQWMLWAGLVSSLGKSVQEEKGPVCESRRCVERSGGREEVTTSKGGGPPRGRALGATSTELRARVQRWMGKRGPEVYESVKKPGGERTERDRAPGEDGLEGRHQDPVEGRMGEPRPTGGSGVGVHCTPVMEHLPPGLVEAGRPQGGWRGQTVQGGCVRYCCCGLYWVPPKVIWWSCSPQCLRL